MFVVAPSALSCFGLLFLLSRACTRNVGKHMCLVVVLADSEDVKKPGRCPKYEAVERFDVAKYMGIW